MLAHDRQPGALPVLSVFDFDGTLTYRDSFVPFLLHAFGGRIFAAKMLRMALPSLSYLCGKLSRDELKATLISVFLTGTPVAWLEEQASAYCTAKWQRLMRPQGLAEVNAQLGQGAHVTLCSASPALVLKPFAARLGVQLIGTELEVVGGVLTGRMVGGNCRRKQKVARLKSVYGALELYNLRAWGDSTGDEHLLAAAQEPHWRAFHPAWRKGRGLNPIHT